MKNKVNSIWLIILAMWVNSFSMLSYGVGFIFSAIILDLIVVLILFVFHSNYRKGVSQDEI